MRNGPLPESAVVILDVGVGNRDRGEAHARAALRRVAVPEV